MTLAAFAEVLRWCVAMATHDYWVCTDCGDEGLGYHGCPGRPGENQW